MQAFQGKPVYLITCPPRIPPHSSPPRSFEGSERATPWYPASERGAGGRLAGRLPASRKVPGGREISLERLGRVLPFALALVSAVALALPRGKGGGAASLGASICSRILGEIRWMENTKSISHHLETMVETRTFVGIYRVIIRHQGFLGGAGFRPSTVCLFARD